MKLPDIFITLASLFNANGYRLYMVGGTSRDFLMGREIPDFDFATDATQEEMKKFLNVNDSFSSIGSMSIFFEGTKVDITTLRKEEGYEDYRHPKNVTYVKDIKEDSARRDFTINAIYLDEKGNCSDFHGGKDDLSKKVLRMIGDPEVRLGEDPLRILRALRFSLALDFEMEDSLKKAIFSKADLLKHLSYSKCYREIEKMKAGDESKAKKILKEYGMDKILPLDANMKNPVNITNIHPFFINGNIYSGESPVTTEKMMKGEFLLQCMDCHSDQNALAAYDYLIRPVLSYSELALNQSRHILSVLLSSFVDASENVLPFYEQGVRIGLVSDADESLIQQMNECGMMIYLSDGNAESVLRVLKNSSKPVLVSSSYFTAEEKELPEIIHQKKGAFGISFQNGEDTVSFVKRIRSFYKQGLLDNIVLELDFDEKKNTSVKDASGGKEIVEEMVRQGFTPSEIARVTHKNFLRVWRQNENKSANFRKNQ